jgi:hypothetical protein
MKNSTIMIWISLILLTLSILSSTSSIIGYSHSPIITLLLSIILSTISGWILGAASAIKYKFPHDTIDDNV